ncbi:non-canonical purine NTP pyrophosphatase [Nocardioides insulae]|uniref:non-canonical purine NTP pyrophosphatase n=1 Tax=Nocardioides insulae TaxID=394734 RepID=UPI0003F7633D|nr:non-canonical purine NTP pyrophosphatase [Nocardioides insulae]
MASIHVASRNAKKIHEMERILAEHLPAVQVVGLDDVPHYDEPVEDAATFEGNALIKARAGYAATGLPTVADDSGLCVDALNGMPGVLSARWSGRRRDAASGVEVSGVVVSGEADEARAGQDERNNRLLLDQLADVPDQRRGAHFTCAIAFVHGPSERDAILVEGRMPGQVIRETRGEGGFGYDVLFVADALPTGTTAELTRDQKDAISHRGHALREIAPLIAGVLGG